MLNGFGVLIGGVFLGAVGAEIIRKKCPEVLDKVYAKTRQVASAAKDAFKRGYDGVAQSHRSAPPSADDRPENAGK